MPTPKKYRYIPGCPYKHFERAWLCPYCCPPPEPVCCSPEEAEQVRQASLNWKRMRDDARKKREE